MENLNWEKAVDTNRFVAYFDILGFKNMVLELDNEEIGKKLTLLMKELNKRIEAKDLLNVFKNRGLKENQTKQVVFSDSIFIFSHGSTWLDLFKIVYDSFYIWINSINNQTPLKGCISFGKINVDFNKSIFYGKPIINSYLLHEEMKMIGVMLDNSVESFFESLNPENQELKFYKTVTTDYFAPFRSGKITHRFIKPNDAVRRDGLVESVSRLYRNISGDPRIYIDNTISYLNSIQY